MVAPATQLAGSEPAPPVLKLFSSPQKRTLFLSLALVLLVTVVYLSVRSNQFINFDDNQYILANVHVRTGLSWQTFQWAFTTSDAANWHPLTWLSHALDCQLFGLNPSAHHFVNVLLHALNVVLLFLVFQRLTARTWSSLAIAALFAVHPLNVEAVAWAAERKTVLSVLFFLLGIWTYAAFIRKRTVVTYLRVIALFALGLMAKPQVIIFPFVLLLLDYWPLRRTRLLVPGATEGSISGIKQQSFPRLLLEKIPLFMLSAVSAVVTMAAQHAGNAVRTTAEYPLAVRTENAVVCYIAYLRDVFCPYRLVPLYPHPGGFDIWKVFVAAGALAGLSCLAFLARRNAPYLTFGWLWFLGTLVPMIGIVQVGEQGRADRYMYIPLMGLLVAIVWGVADLFRELKLSMVWQVSAFVIVLVIFSILTYRQVGLWRNSETLWNYTLSVTKDNFMAEDNLAQELAHQGRTEEALVHFHRALALHNYEPSQLIAFGVYEQRNGHAADAINQYERAFRNSSDPATRAVALSNMGSAYIEAKDLDHAKASFDQALQYDPKNVPALLGSGLIAHRSGDWQSAISSYSKALSINPSDLGYELLAMALEQSGKGPDANRAYERARQLSSNPQEVRLTAEHLLKP